MPLMNYKGYRDGLTDLGVGPSDIGYYSQVQDWKMQVATPNNTTPMILTHWNFKDGPIVIELPGSADGIGIFGTIMDSWERALDDVGAFGRDRGLGAKYVLVPPNYNGPLLPNAYVYTQETYNGMMVLRPIMKGGPTPENLAKATALAKQVKVYPLSQANKPPKNKYVDLYGKVVEGIPLYSNIHEEIHEIIQEEVVLDRDQSMMGLLAQIGIKKGEKFQPDAKLKAILDEAAAEAHEYLIEQYHRVLTPLVYEGKKWRSLVPAGVRETDFTWEFPSYYDYHARGAVYYGLITSIKNYGAATFYVTLAETQGGEWMDGSKNYKLVMPADAPVRDFWSITTYDLESASYVREVPRSTIDSNMKDIKKNADGTVDIYFGPTAPNGKEGNWLPTDPNRRFFMMARFYGPQPGLYDGSFELNNIELVR